MTKRGFALERGGPRRLEVSWSGVWKNFQITFDGAPVGGFETTRELEAGGTFTLPDGSRLLVQLKRSGLGASLQVLRDGVPLPSASDGPAERVSFAVGLLYFVAAVNGGFGAFAELGHVTYLLRLGVGLGSVVVAVVYASLAYLTQAKRSLLALVLASGLLAFDGIASFVLVGRDEHRIVTLILRMTILIPILRGVPALNELTRRPRAATWTDRRAFIRQQRNDAVKSAQAPRVPHRWSRKVKIVLAAGVVVITAAVVIVLFAPRTRAATAALCENQGPDAQIDRCIENWAIRTNDAGLCAAMRSVERANMCIARINESEVCLRLARPSDRGACITGRAR